MDVDTPTAADPSGPHITIRRRLEWMDSDASGHHHNSVIIRWIEAAEVELLDGLGLRDLFARMPRVRHTMDHHRPIQVDDAVDVTIAVAHVGRSSIRYDFEVRLVAGAAAASGHVTAVHVDPVAVKAVPWPEEARAALTTPRQVTPRPPG